MLCAHILRGLLTATGAINRDASEVILRDMDQIDQNHTTTNGCDGVSNHQPRDCLLNRLFRHKSKRHQSTASLAFVWGIHRGPVNSPHKWPVTQKMFPFDDAIIYNNANRERIARGVLLIMIYSLHFIEHGMPNYFIHAPDISYSQSPKYENRKTQTNCVLNKRDILQWNDACN